MLFDRIIAHQVLYFLQNTSLKNYDKISSDFNLQVEQFLKEKFVLISYDPISRSKNIISIE